MEGFKLNNMDAWRLTADEKQEIKVALEKFDEARVDHFIDELELICVQFKLLLGRLPTDNGKRRPILPLDRYVPSQDKKRISSRLKKTIAELEYLYSHNYLLGLGPSYRTDLSQKGLLADFFSDQMLILETEENLKKIYSMLEETSPPVSSVDPFKFATAIGFLFSQLFGKPTKYVDGAFFNVLRTCYNSVGIQIDNPKEHAKAAIKNLG